MNKNTISQKAYEKLWNSTEGVSSVIKKFSVNTLYGFCNCIYACILVSFYIWHNI